MIANHELTSITVMLVKQGHKPPIWEWFIYTTYKNADFPGDCLLFYPH